MPVIDVHNHVIPTSVVDALKRPGNLFRCELRDGVMVHQEGNQVPLIPEMHQIESKLARLDASSIDLAVVSPSPTLLGCDHPANEAAAACALLNDGLLEMVARAPARLRAMPAISVADPGSAVQELARMVKYGCHSVIIGVDAEGRRLGSPQLRPFWKLVEQYRTVVFVHPFFSGPKPGIEQYYLTNLVGNPLETTLAMAEIIFSGLLDECPGLRILLAHGGGFAPYQFGRLRHGYQVRTEPREHCAKPPDRYLENFYFDTITHDPDVLRFLVGFAGAEHVLLGTDLPFDMADARPVATIQAAGLPAEERELLLGGNALSLIWN